MRGDEGAERVDQVVFVVNIPAVDALAIVDAIIQTHNVLSHIKRVRPLIESVIRYGRIGEGYRELRHCPVDICQSAAIRGDPIGRDLVAGELLLGDRVNQPAIICGSRFAIRTGESQ